MEYVSHPVPGKLWVIQLAEELGRRIRQSIQGWPAWEKHGLGDQLIRSMDSVGANITEGYARVHLKERLNFISIAQGSLEETLFWVRRARDRCLFSEEDAGIYSNLLIKLSNAVANLATYYMKASSDCK